VTCAAAALVWSGFWEHLRVERCDVAVVGAGPVGLLTAVLLGQAGHDVVLLERRERPYGLPRAVHYDDEAARVLAAAGLADALAPLVEPAGVYEWRNAAGDTLLAFDRSQRGPSGWPEGTLFSQPDLERVLTDRVAELPAVSLRRGVEAFAVTDEGSSARVVTADGELTAAWVVGADGARSTVRSAVGGPVTDLGFASDWLVADLRMRRERTFEPSFWQLCDPARPTTVVPSGPGRRRWEFLRPPGAPEPDEAEVWRMLAEWDVAPEDADLERWTVYRFEARWAERWRAGRLLLAGDAAHEMPPFLGQGMCAGVRDAAALAWRLDSVLSGTAGDALLDSYGSERREHVRTVTELSVELGKVVCLTDPEEAVARDAAMTAGGPVQRGSSVLDVALGPGLTLADRSASPDPLAGHLAPQGVLALDGRRGLADDVVGRQWILLVAADAGELPADAARRFRALGGRVVPVGPDVDVDGTYRSWLTAAGRQTALLRPDGYVFGSGGVGDRARLVEALLSRWPGP
jgi:2-polyprenyl-6-methoxyphenol hydroxylase-like FAD-dependent oxidoreductase